MRTRRRDARRTAGWSWSQRRAAKYCGVPEGISYVVNTRSCARRRAAAKRRHSQEVRTDASASAKEPARNSFFI